jgi:hypothetical protein
VLDVIDTHLVSQMDEVLTIALATPLPNRLPAVVSEVAATDSGESRTH